MPKRLLIADDDALFSRLLSTEIAPRGYAVSAVAEPGAAIAAIESERPDLLILDLRFKGANGITVLEHVRERAYDLPVMVVTNFPKSVHGDACARLGAAEYIVKTEWKIDRLVARVLEMLA